MSSTRYLESRTDDSSQATTHGESCTHLSDRELVISRTAFITSLTVCIVITGLSLLALTILLYREANRRRQIKAARTWGRQSRLANRLSMLQKEADDSYRRQHFGCHVNEPENPEMGSDSPVEIMYPEDRVWEAPAVPAKAHQGRSNGRKSKISDEDFSPAATNAPDQIKEWCPLSPKSTPPEDGLEDSRVLFALDKVLGRQVERLSAVVNVSTISYDDNGPVGEDMRWETFGELHAVLEKLFPVIAQQVEVEKINKYGLLYYLPGTDPTLKPILLMAHQDVVPPMDPRQWTHPPFQAYFDGEWLWGRGASDCKSNLIGILTAIDALLAQTYTPRRPILLAFGFDEETGGMQGAAEIARHLERNMGNDSLAMVFDEGGMGVKTLGDVAYALPAVAEKGFVDIVLTLETNGGHSSRPPKHTSIGIMSKIVEALEDNPFSPVLDRSNPVRQVLQCESVFSPSSVEPWLRKELASDGPARDLGEKIVDSRGDAIRWQIQTSQAVDIIHGGSKDNQLPSRVELTVNYRISPHDDVEALLNGVAKRVATVAHEFNIAVSGLGFGEEQTENGIIHLESKDLLRPSPITPASSASEVWSIFSGTLRQVYESVKTLPGIETVVPVGSIATGNSDTAHYWKLTRNIFRFTPSREGSRLGIHDIDERIQMSDHVEAIRVYYDLIRNFQAYDGDACDGACLYPMDLVGKAHPLRART
ncbi:hypothetical protein PRZ48_010812 [Zasmidium cellare]|uniref:Peptidase M20 dimerisation domain-containing protein n=1 Tax=Zasmidium cellare TaxID=395010 RepID=A0ABR0EA93_ZASCE|nr:hypothetical protein PRZ48_010812 [Zasmidium cellare]